jgi:hypothetical protein
MPNTRKQKSELSLLKQYCELGFKLFPCQYKGGKKVPRLKGWQSKATSDYKQVSTWYSQFPGGLWGLATGSASGVLVVDVDIRSDKNGDAALKQKLGGSVPNTPMVRTPSGGYHLYFTDPGNVTISSSKEGIDVRGTGGYVILPPGSINNHDYVWAKPITNRGFASVPEALLPSATQAKKKKQADTSNVTFDQLKHKVLWALAWLDPERANAEYHDWLNIIFAAGDVSTDDPDIIEALEKFSRRSPKYKHNDVRNKLATLNGSRGSKITYATLVKMANEDKPKMEQASSDAAWEISRMSISRFEDPVKRMEVANALVYLGDFGERIWLDKCSAVPGLSKMECRRDWATLKLNASGLAQLQAWAKEDEPDASTIPAAPARPLLRHYVMAMEALGYNFAKNEMDDTIFFNGVKMDDFTDARIRMKLLDHGYKSKAHIIDAMLVIADDHRFHPIRSYLKSTKWNGEDSIGKLASYFRDANNLFPLLLRKWLIGAVNKVLSGTGEFNPMLVLDGPQRIGKSKFARWLCSGIPAYWGLLNTMQVDKDEKIKLSSFFILEAPEISALFSKADREALKVFLSMETVTERAPYGKFPLNKPVTASFIGTLNNIGGFLSDSTGESRFRTCTIQSIDWRGYTKDVDIDQVWAQAVALWDSGETIELSKEDQEAVDVVNQSYKMEDTISRYIDEYFEITRDPKDFIAALDIESTLRSAGAPLGISPHAGLMRIANELIGRGLVRTRVLSNGTLKNTWTGIKARETPPFDAAVAAETLFKGAKVKS